MHTSRRSLTILLGLGDGVRRDELTATLRDDHVCHIATSIAAATELASTRKVDLAIVGIGLLGGDTLDLIRALRVRPHPIATVVLGNGAPGALAFEAGRLGVLAFVDGSGAPTQLRSIVQAHLRWVSGTTEYRLRAYAQHLEHIIDTEFRNHALTVGSVAAVLGVTPDHLSRIIRRDYGCRFTDLLRERRLREACWLLTHTVERTKQVAISCGFTATAHLDHSFKRAYGRSPTAYRALMTTISDVSRHAGEVNSADAGVRQQITAVGNQ